MTLRLVRFTRTDKDGKSHTEVRAVDIQDPPQIPRNRHERRKKLAEDRRAAKLNKHKEQHSND